METPRMADRRIALIGDAAFVARPYTAMGVAKAAGRDGAGSCGRARLDIGRTKRVRKGRLDAGAAIVAYGRRLGASLN